MENGLIQIYTGDGKGKTTASLGLAVRALGRNLNTAVIHFFKSKESGEELFFKKYNVNITIHKPCSQNKFYYQMNDEEKNILKKEIISGFNIAKDYLNKKNIDILILDEISYCINYNIINLHDFITFLKNKDKIVEIILTGRDFKNEIIEIADLVTEMNKIKHPFDKGIQARIGIEE